MTEATKQTGRCLCGAVSISVSNASNEVGACHCGMCRQWGGGPFMGVDCGADVSFKGEENISVYDSSMWAERGFCRKCGSHLFYRIKGSGQHFIPVGLLDDQEHLVFESQVFVDKKPSYYSFSNDTAEMTEAEVFERYGPQQE